MKFPAMVRVRQHFNTKSIQDIPETVRAELAKLDLPKIISKGQTVAIGAGSRGIANIATVVCEVVRELKKIGARPFVFPAMGSHGGATAQGQKNILAHYGITRETTGAPIKATMEVVQISTTQDGVPVFVDKNAYGADHIVVVNRVKPHTDYSGQIESGLIKMMAIGLGKQKGADHYHNTFLHLGHEPVLVSIAREILKHCPIAFGLALLENQRDETDTIRAIPAAEIEETERKLLRRAKRLLAGLPVDPIDLLVVDQMGKNISGSGMDQNVIARAVIPYHTTPKKPRITRIFVRDFTPNSDGNATGIGNADFTTKRLVDKIDRRATYMNAITSCGPEIVRIPPYFETDREAIEAALTTVGVVEPENARVVHIRDTLSLETMYVSEAFLPELQNQKNVSVEGSPRAMKFDKKGNLITDL
jgi:hypothetical protein